MAPHNLTEVVNGTLAYIQNRDIEIDELMQHVKAPDFQLAESSMDMTELKMLFIQGVVE
jgi:DNA gyrase/topoisomerase IV subunit A